MTAEAQISGLESYEIGIKIHKLRKKKGLSLVKLGEHTGTSAGLLSKIERGRLIPTLPTLMKIALVFGVGLDHFFADGPETPRAAVIRKDERLRLPNRADSCDPTYLFESLDFPVTDRAMDAYLATFRAGAAETDPHMHPGAEVIYVISGTLVVRVEGEVFELKSGDSMYFDGALPHSYCQKGKDACSAVVVVAR
jgi:transcriptional regulator with XRE-family HTH domain